MSYNRLISYFGLSTNGQPDKLAICPEAEPGPSSRLAPIACDWSAA